ncbi:MAG: DUF1178 family protein [Erythrobacter sp.]|uniref:DUF1178 family protein n=1 Tax=Erythrobacter sp. TaxID=1042 RepID=UPI0032EB4864
MIVFDLHCEAGHRFEGWFGSSTDFDSQCQRGLVTCPECGSGDIAKAPMAPAVPAKGNSACAQLREQPARNIEAPSDGGQTVSNREMSAEVQAAMKHLATVQAKVLEKSRWVGDAFTEQSRAMHYGERDAAPIYGSASLGEAKELIDEGVPVTPLPFPVAPPDEVN